MKQMNELLEDLNKTITIIDRRLARLEAVLKLRRVPENAEMDALVESLKASIFDRISASWNESKTPTESRNLAQIYGRRASPIGGIDTITRILLEEDQIESVTRLTGAKMYVPKGALEGLTREGLETLREYGMRESDIKRYRTKEKTALLKRTSAELTADEEAEIDRLNAEFIKKVESQKGII